MPLFIDMDGVKLIKLFEIKAKVNQTTMIYSSENVFLGITMLLHVNQR